MSDNTIDDPEEWLTESDTVETTLHTPDGALELEVQDATRNELNALEEQAGEGPEAEEEAMRAAIRKFLVDPDVDPDDMPMRKRALVWYGMQQAWSGAEEIHTAMEELELPGNTEPRG